MYDLMCNDNECFGAKFINKENKDVLMVAVLQLSQLVVSVDFIKRQLIHDTQLAMVLLSNPCPKNARFRVRPISPTVFWVK